VDSSVTAPVYVVESHRTPGGMAQQFSFGRYDCCVSVVRFALGVLIALLALLAALPAVVLIDLVAGGTGLGLCADGLGTCATSMYTMAELFIILFGLVALVSGGVALCVRVLRRSAA
jgi:hypothetical protein